MRKKEYTECKETKRKYGKEDSNETEVRRRSGAGWRAICVGTVALGRHVPVWNAAYRSSGRQVRDNREKLVPTSRGWGVLSDKRPGPAEKGMDEFQCCYAFVSPNVLMDYELTICLDTVSASAITTWPAL